MKKIANSKNFQKASWLLLGSNVSQHLESICEDNRENPSLQSKAAKPANKLNKSPLTQIITQSSFAA